MIHSVDQVSVFISSKLNLTSLSQLSSIIFIKQNIIYNACLFLIIIILSIIILNTSKFLWTIVLLFSQQVDQPYKQPTSNSVLASSYNPSKAGAHSIPCNLIHSSGEKEIDSYISYGLLFEINAKTSARINHFPRRQALP